MSSGNGPGFFVIRSRSIKDTFYRSCRIACLGAAIVGCATQSASAQAAANVSAAEICLAANSNLSLGARLPRTADHFKSGEPLKIVAIGSSSTVGLWEFRPAATYPEVMRREIQRLQSNARISVVNSGRVGETIPDNIARFERGRRFRIRAGISCFMAAGHQRHCLGRPCRRPAQGQSRSGRPRAQGQRRRCGPDRPARHADGAGVRLLFENAGTHNRGCPARTDRPVFPVRIDAQIDRRRPGAGTHSSPGTDCTIRPKAMIASGERWRAPTASTH